ncbi:HK97 gp10 family phage protein [Capnocytophaga canimorsus]|nr:HK97 gp10 family phage protein [Capnocytophaga canimorsus]WGU68275.1 HK97 gp10 family phage protein [Capnocytophaga canimorsus]WGU70621.1 HK97 gp10 family phage protein [Capnocytophaga canimorsus]
MAIKPNFTQDDIRKRFNAFLEEVEHQQIEALKELGERCMAHARSVPSSSGFQDQTGNLRSSIGYVVFKNGVAIHEGYEAITGTNSKGETLNGTEGVTSGRKLAESVGNKTQGICLVVTAGMNYASYVEAKGRDVITSAEILAERELPRMLEELKDNIRNV